MERKNTNIIDTVLCILSSLIKKWKTIVLCMMVCGIALDLFQTFTFERKYVSSISISLKQNDSYSNMGASVDYAKTMAYVFKSNVVSDYICEEMGVESLPGTITTQELSETGILKINAYSKNVVTSYRMILLIEKWYEENQTTLSGYEMKIVEQDLINENPINMNSHFSNFITGAFISGIILSLFYVLIFYFRDNVKSADSFSSKIDCRLLGKLPYEWKDDKIKGRKSALLISDLRTSFAYTESVKKLCSRISASCEKHAYKTILVTSSVENEGKSSVTANLALALAKRNSKVLLIDGDMRKHAVKKIFGVRKGNVGKILKKESTLKEELVYMEKHNLFVIGGEVCDVKNNTYEQEWKKLLEDCKKIFDYVIVDTAPCRFISDTLNIAPLCDASIMVVKQNEAPSKLINDTIYRLQYSRANLIGCVFNASVFSVKKSVHGQNHYGYGGYGRNIYKRRSGREK